MAFSSGFVNGLSPIAKTFPQFHRPASAQQGEILKAAILRLSTGLAPQAPF